MLPFKPNDSQPIPVESNQNNSSTSSPKRWPTIVSTTLIGLWIFSFILPRVGKEHPHFFGLSILVSLAIFGFSIFLWTQGLQNAGRGWRRWLFLLAFAFPIAETITTTRTAGEGWVAGYNAGLYDEKQLNNTPSPQSTPSRDRTWSDNLDLALVTATLILTFHFLERHKSEAERQRRAATEAQDQVLRAKLAPHFIFNALNTLHAQIESNPRGAQATTEKLADLFRQVVQMSGQPTILLRQELAFVEAYLGIEQARLGDRLTVRIEIPEELEDSKIPPLSLQVLVENAVKHGIAPSELGGKILIGARRLNSNTLEFWVQDPGSGVAPTPGTGTALESLRQRLARPEDLCLEPNDQGFRVSFLSRHT